jgi:hypothetical protein
MDSSIKNALIQIVKSSGTENASELERLYLIRSHLLELIADAEEETHLPAYKQRMGGIVLTGLSVGISIDVEDYHAGKIVVPYGALERLQSRVHRRDGAMQNVEADMSTVV